MFFREKAVQKAAERAGFNVREEVAKIRGKTPRQVEDAEHLRLRELNIALYAASDREAELVQERVLDGNDLININYLERGVHASRSIARIHVRDAAGQTREYGTGFLVAPRLLLTNHHVLETADAARRSLAEFDYEYDIEGKTKPSHFYTLHPDDFFHTDPALDFSVVAVSSRADDTGKPLADFGWLKLQARLGKVVLAEYLTIIQHPGAQRKQICLRNNQLIRRDDDVLWYATDTQSGSSGAAVFSDAWQVVALHHSGVPDKDEQDQIRTTDGQVFDARTMDESRIKWIANEGIRISRIVAALSGQQGHPLVRPLFEAEPVRVPIPAAAQPSRGEVSRPAAPSASPAPASVDGQGLVLTLPLQINLSLGHAAPAPAERGTTAAATAGLAMVEKIEIDPDYDSRDGYDADFLGSGERAVPLPALGSLLNHVVRLPGTGQYELKYHHFSLVMHDQRRLAIFTAVNIDGNLKKDLETRSGDRWFFDPRIPKELQVGNQLYADNELDRGHLVRRLDPAWGKTIKVAKAANDDTFHWTNCSPQHAQFNQNDATWQGLENYLLYTAQNEGFRASVFSGPVFRATDELYRGVRLPREYWKVAVMVYQGALSATAYLLSQEDLLQTLEAEAFRYSDFNSFQVPVAMVEAKSGLNFGGLRNFDPLQSDEAAAAIERAPAGLLEAYPELVRGRTMRKLSSLRDITFTREGSGVRPFRKNRAS